MAEGGFNIDGELLRREDLQGFDTEELQNLLQREETRRIRAVVDLYKQLKEIETIHRGRKGRTLSDIEEIREEQIIIGIKSLCSRTSVDIHEIPAAANLKEKFCVFLDTEIRSKLVEKGYEGRFRPIGSTFDQTRVSPSTDFDFFFEIHSARTLSNGDLNTFQLRGTGYSRSVVVNDQSLKPWFFYKVFADDLFDIFSDLGHLPEGITFGGFASPKFSGVRYNEPAVTFLFKWRGNTVTSVDITPALLIPNENLHHFPALSRELTRLLPSDESEIRPELHVVPIWLYGEEWCLTTAALEQQLFSVLPNDPVRNTIKECKLKCKEVTDLVHTLYQQKFQESDSQYPLFLDWVFSSLKTYNRNKEDHPREAEELRELLMQILSVGHIFLSHEKAAEFSEIGSKLVSINSSALKYLTLNSTTNCCSSRVLADLQASSPVQHTFLTYIVAKLSVNCILIPELQTICDVIDHCLKHGSTT